MAYLAYLSYLVVYYLILTCLSVYIVVRYKGGLSFFNSTSLLSRCLGSSSPACIRGSGIGLPILAQLAPVVISNLLPTKFHLQTMQNSWQFHTWTNLHALPKAILWILDLQQTPWLQNCVADNDFYCHSHQSITAPQVKKHVYAQTRGWATQIGGASAVTTNAVFHLWVTRASFHLCWGIRCELRRKRFKIYFKNSRLYILQSFLECISNDVLDLFVRPLIGIPNHSTYYSACKRPLIGKKLHPCAKGV